MLSALHTMQSTPKRLDRDNADTAADIIIELMYRIDDSAAVLDNKNWCFEVECYKRYLNVSTNFLSTNVLQMM